MFLARSCLSLFVAVLAGCTGGLPPLKGRPEAVDLERFSGAWFVAGFIPIDFPFLSEAGAHNGVESYSLDPDGTIATTYTFRDGGFDGPERVMRPRGRSFNPPVNSHWKMKFKPFLPAGDYLILWIDEDYQRTVIGVPDRRWIWLMTRECKVSDGVYQALVDQARNAGYDTQAIRRVPQRC
jgi:apolipoprotein D and lipocalin family protein